MSGATLGVAARLKTQPYPSAAIGVDIGGTKTLAVTYLPDQILAHARIATNTAGSPEEILRSTAKLIATLRTQAHDSGIEVPCVGLGLPGILSTDRMFVDSIILPRWKNVNVERILLQMLDDDIELTIDNDAVMMARGQWTLKAGNGHGILVCLTLGTGVGASVILNGTPLRGPDGIAGQLGHMSVNASGRQCVCGGIGCLNAYASGTAITERYLQRDDATTQHISPIDGRWVGDQAAKGNRIAQAIIDETAVYLGVGIASLINIFNPSHVIIGGGVSDLGEALLAPARRVAHKRSFPSAAARARITTPHYRSSAGAVGAAIAALHAHEADSP
ncbi:ROK family protein [Pseudonocardia sp. 73-21]|uniref:ROK family protein n=1 Tax=Pseudonocardia sp. 73-21 TaxID=1895809 RepID=UPI002637FE92|nr:ROK family protein [Pseudonocardia sp. 73-21]